RDPIVRPSPGMQNRSARDSNQKEASSIGRQITYFILETNSNNWKWEELKALLSAMALAEGATAKDV
ncbi:hypothetical protein, partial [Bradyrhizobium manausense]|uniref:hypothetical protein n=1 Tax=Bradyrhizobium manausense TaxID=989370 RepID=UPI00196A2B9C